MNRKLYWLILINPAFLVLYGWGISVVYEFCRYGGIAKRLPAIAAFFLIIIVWIIVWTIFYFVWKKHHGNGKRKRWVGAVLAIELAVLLLCTGYYGQKIYQTAQPFSGKLGSFLSDLKSQREFSLEDAECNFLENGLDGILESLSEHCGLDSDWELYTANTFSCSIDENGKIQALEAFLYAYDEETFHSWLISYDAAKSEKMTVYLDGNADTEYKEQEQMTPFFTMIDAMLKSDLMESLGMSDKEKDTSAGGVDETEASTDTVDGEETETAAEQKLFVLTYSGYAGGSYQADSWYVVTESDSGNSLSSYVAPVLGVTDEGFLLTIYSGDSKVATIATGIGTMETAAAIQEREKAESEVENAGKQGKTLISDDSGMTFYLDEKTSMSLTVTDAAAGSRAYAFQNGDIFNEDPFSGSYGVAESIYFIDGSTGMILLTNASQDRSSMYYTQDGGITFTLVTLPVSDGEADMADNEFGYTPEDMDYIEPPYEEDNRLYVAVSCDHADTEYISMLFVSENNGQSWQYLSYEEKF